MGKVIKFQGLNGEHNEDLGLKFWKMIRIWGKHGAKVKDLGLKWGI